jgi:hypothetical protein
MIASLQVAMRLDERMASAALTSSYALAKAWLLEGD